MCTCASAAAHTLLVVRLHHLHKLLRPRVEVELATRLAYVDSEDGPAIPTISQPDEPAVGEDLRVTTTHLSYMFWWAVPQLGRALRAATAGHDGPGILVGDVNLPMWGKLATEPPGAPNNLCAVLHEDPADAGQKCSYGCREQWASMSKAPPSSKALPVPNRAALSLGPGRELPFGAGG